ncbi:MAG: TOBE domain-containing protein, partial [Prolixibacteraceae bacterium]|nr:TOBE domain-containing protein [Burkholderiales bacterium]
MDQTTPHTRLLGKLEVNTEFGLFLGDTRIRLLKEIDRHGSISQAAKHVPMSYKAAWDAVDAMNNLSEAPLFDRTTGGKHGGGTKLTEYGRTVIHLYQALAEQYQSSLDRLAERMRDLEGSDIREFQSLLRRMSMKTSARNQFVGSVTGLREGGVDFEVRLRIDPENELVAVITRESAEYLDLRIGGEVHAFVKSSSVLLLTDPAGRTSARNHLWGTVSRIHHSAVNSQVTLQLSAGKTVTAVITH